MSTSTVQPSQDVNVSEMSSISLNGETNKDIINNVVDDAYTQYSSAINVLDQKISDGRFTCATAARLRRSAFIFRYVIENSVTFEGSEQTALHLAAQREWDKKKDSIFPKKFQELRLEEFRTMKEEPEEENQDPIDDVEDDIPELFEEKAEKKFVSKKDFVTAAAERIFHEAGGSITRKVAAQKASREWNTSLENPKFRKETLSSVNSMLLAFHSILTAPEEHQQLIMQEMVMKCGRTLSTFCGNIDKLSPQDIIRKLEEFKEHVEKL